MCKLQQGQSFLVSDDGAVGVQLQNRSRNLGIDRAGDSSLDCSSLILAVGDQQQLLCLHDAPDTHGVSLLGHIITGFEETGVGIDGGVS